MDLLEYQGKQLFARNGVPVSDGRYAASVEAAAAVANEIGYPCVVKAQVLIGGRGKAGGIKIAQNEAEARKYAEAILGMDITGPHGEGPYTVHELWLEQSSDIDEEYYASFILDRSEKKVLAILSRMGGMDVEAIAETDPEALAKRHVDPVKGFSLEDAQALVAEAKLAGDVQEQAAGVLVELCETFNSADATLIEVNPLIVNSGRKMIALDAKVTIDDSALFRQQQLAEFDQLEAVEDSQERMAKEMGLTYVKLGGDIGILGNGAGLCMSTLDVVAQAGGDPANFLDAGGGSKAEAIVDALTVITSDENVKAILFNIFGGITRCDEVATGILEATRQMGLTLPLVIRLDGTNSEEGLRLLAEAGFPNLHQEKTMLAAAARVVELAKG